MKKKLIKILTAVTAVILLTAFTDVPKDHWAHDIINQAQNLGLVKGVSENLYEPQRPVTKQEMAIIFYRVRSLFNADMQDEDYIENQNVALQSGQVADWAQREVSYGLEKGFWLSGDFSGGTAGESASRQMIARWLFTSTPNLRDFGLMVFPYKDYADIDQAYYPYVDAMYKYGIMIGSGETFNPVQGISRAEAATVALRMKSIISGESKEIEKKPFVYESGVLSDFNSKNRSFKLGDKLVCISSDSKILLDGKIVDFSKISDLKGKQVVASLYVNADNTKSVILQSKPVALNGKVEKVVSRSISGVSHDVVTISVGGTSFDYVKNADTDVLKTITAGKDVTFIADGIYLLEIK